MNGSLHGKHHFIFINYFNKEIDINEDNIENILTELKINYRYVENFHSNLLLYI